MEQYSKIGMEKLIEILGDEHADCAIKHFENLSPDFSRCLVDFVYGMVASRSKISGKLRELALVSNIMGQGSNSFALQTHLKAMLNVGWTKAEVIDIIIELTPYNGFPRCIETLEIFKIVCDEFNL